MEIIDLVGDIPVSAECVETDVDKLMKEAQDIASWAPNIYVKVPMTANAMEVVKELSPKGINFNVTLIFSLPQALIAGQGGRRRSSRSSWDALTTWAAWKRRRTSLTPWRWSRPMSSPKTRRFWSRPSAARSR